MSQTRPTSTAELREAMRQQTLKGIGGWSGALITALPTVVFVLVNIVSSLWPAIYAAVGTALLLAGYRLVRKQPTQQALSGLFGVLIAAVIAARSGEARGYYLFGIITSFVYAVPFLVSVVVRRPLVGLFWEFLEPTPPTREQDPAVPPWYRRAPLLRAYSWATLAGFLLFALRGTVQGVLYQHKADGWLGVARIAMGYPLFILAVGFAFLIVRRARAQLELAAATDSNPAAGLDPTLDPALDSGLDGQDRSP